jgi:predicted P-loop ATPase
MALTPDFKEIVKLKWIFGRDRQPLSVIGLRPAEKSPAMAFKDQIDDGPWSEDRLRVEWQAAGGRLNPAILAGPLSGPYGLVIVDADNAEGLAWCQANLPPSVMATATRRGGHLYFRWNAGAEIQGNRVDVLGSRARFAHEALAAGFDVKIRNGRGDTAAHAAGERVRVEEEVKKAVAAGVSLGPMIDVRGQGGYVVAPPAVNIKTGFVYTQVEPWHRDMELPLWQPSWIADKKWKSPTAVTVALPGEHPAETAMKAARRRDLEAGVASNCTAAEKLRRASAYLATVDPAIEGSGGQNQLYYAACRLVQGFALDEGEALTLLKDEYNPRCQPQWADWELMRKVEHAGREDCANAGFLLVDRPEWELGKHMTDIKVFDPSAAPGPDNDAYGDEYYDDDGQLVTTPVKPQPAKATANGPSQPQPQQAPQPQMATVHVLKTSPAWTSDEQKFAALWKRLGVDYAQVRDSPWIRTQNVTGQWVIKPTTNNITQVLLHGQINRRELQWNDLKRSWQCDGRPMEDIDQEKIRENLSFIFHEELSKEKVESAIKVACHERHYDPWREKVEALPAWDGADHLGTFLTDVLGLKADEDHDAWRQNYTEWRHQLTGVMARGLCPGRKVQTILIIVGAQGRFKSTLLKELVDGDTRNKKDRKMFTDAKFKIDDRDGLMVVGTHNVMEWGESEHAKSARAVDNVKAFLARDHDVFREPYGKDIVSVKRRCVFFGTSNDREGLLHDATGHRRFYICDLGANVLNLKRLRAIHDQLWAQIRHLYAMHEMAEAWLAEDPDSVWGRELLDASRWWYEAEEEAARAQSLKAYEARSVHYDTLARFVAERQAQKDEGKRLFDMDSLYKAMELSAAARDKALESELLMTLKQLGCVRGPQRRVNGVKARWWQPPSAADQSTLSPYDDYGDQEF